MECCRQVGEVELVVTGFNKGGYRPFCQGQRAAGFIGNHVKGFPQIHGLFPLSFAAGKSIGLRGNTAGYNLHDRVFDIQNRVGKAIELVVTRQTGLFFPATQFAGLRP